MNPVNSCVAALAVAVIFYIYRAYTHVQTRRQRFACASASPTCCGSWPTRPNATGPSRSTSTPSTRGGPITSPVRQYLDRSARRGAGAQGLWRVRVLRRWIVPGEELSSLTGQGLLLRLFFRQRIHVPGQGKRRNRKSSATSGLPQHGSFWSNSSQDDWTSDLISSSRLPTIPGWRGQ